MPDGQNAIGFDQLGNADLVVGWIYRGGTAPNVGSEPINKLLPGSGNQGGFRAIGKPARDEVKAVVLFTTGKEAGWPDALDPETGLFAYFGDNREPGRALEDTPRGGNRLLRQVFARAHGTPADRAKVPPFLLFDKAGQGRDVRFRGLLAPGGAQIAGDADLATVNSSKGDQAFQNYQAHFTLLNVPVISRGWIVQILDGDPLGSDCPAEWRAWVESRLYAPLIGSPASDGQDIDDQAPPPDDHDAGMLSAITRDGVIAAIAEYDERGRETFLAEYGFKQARTYLLKYRGKDYDSKAIAGVAHRFLGDGSRALPADRFSGGQAGAARTLRRLGFSVYAGEVTEAELVRLLSRLATNSPGHIPALYQPITLLWAISRASRGAERLVSWQETRLQVAALISAYGRPGEGDRVYYPVASLYRQGLWEIEAEGEVPPNAHGSSIPQGWFSRHQPRSGLALGIYEIVRDSPDARQTAVRALAAYFVDADAAGLLAELRLGDAPTASPAEAIFAARAAEYRSLCDRAEKSWQTRPRRSAPTETSRPTRSDEAKNAVLLRSEGRCENPECRGDIEDVKDNGEPILEVDHLNDLAGGGPDVPTQMIALCPNCHRIKTYGRTRHQLIPKLFVVAQERHEKLFPGQR